MQTICARALKKPSLRQVAFTLPPLLRNGLLRFMRKRAKDVVCHKSYDKRTV